MTAPSAVELAREGLGLEERRTQGEWQSATVPSNNGTVSVFCNGFPVAITSAVWNRDKSVEIADARFIAFAANHWREMAEAVIAMERVVEWAKRWRTETCSHVIGCDAHDACHGAECEITRNEKDGCALVDALTPTQGADDAG